VARLKRALRSSPQPENTLSFRRQPINRGNLLLFRQVLFKQSTSYIVKKQVNPLIWTAQKLPRITKNGPTDKTR
jgi:hypothetical protein